MSNLSAITYVIDSIGKSYLLDKRENFFVLTIEGTEGKEFWFKEDGSYYGAMTFTSEMDNI